MLAPEATSPVSRPDGPFIPICPRAPWQGWSGTMPRGKALDPQIMVTGWAGAAEGTCDSVGTLSGGHCDWHEPGEWLAVLFLVNTRRGYFTRKQ